MDRETGHRRNPWRLVQPRPKRREMDGSDKKKGAAAPSNFMRLWSETG